MGVTDIIVDSKHGFVSEWLPEVFDLDRKHIHKIDLRSRLFIEGTGWLTVWQDEHLFTELHREPAPESHGPLPRGSERPSRRGRGQLCRSSANVALHLGVARFCQSRPEWTSLTAFSSPIPPYVPQVPSIRQVGYKPNLRHGIKLLQSP